MSGPKGSDVINKQGGDRMVVYDNWSVIGAASASKMPMAGCLSSKITSMVCLTLTSDRHLSLFSTI